MLSLWGRTSLEVELRGRRVFRSNDVLTNGAKTWTFVRLFTYWRKNGLPPAF